MAERVAIRRLLALQYLAHIPPRSPTFCWPSSESLLQIQDGIYKDLFSKEEIEESELNSSYTQSFYKELITRLERAVAESEDVDLEVNEDILQHYASIMASSKINSNANERRRYYYPRKNQESLPGEFADDTDIFNNWDCTMVTEDASTIARGTTGLKTWEASLRLAAHLISIDTDALNQQSVRVLELGSGCGFLGTTIAKQLPRAQIYLTDMDGIALHQLRDTVNDNLSCSNNVIVEALDWLDVLDISSKTATFLTQLKPQVIFGADIIYDPELVEPLCKVIKMALSSNDSSSSSFALIASTIRNEQSFALFLQTLDRLALTAKEVTFHRPHINLRKGNLVEGSFEGIKIELFMSAHNLHRDGQVRLLQITL